MLSRSFSKSAASTGNRPQNTTGWTSLKPGQRLGGGPLGVGDACRRRVVCGDLLDLRGDEADLAGAERVELLDLGAEAADAVDQVLGAGLHEDDLLALAQRRRR